ncbi:MAG: hypothetical protein LM563_06095 [Thermofilum sp.]|nr:hypothetical protein [Thermofilum sp.]
MRARGLGLLGAVVSSAGAALDVVTTVYALGRVAGAHEVNLAGTVEVQVARFLSNPARAQRGRLLDLIEEREPEVEKLGLRDRYGARERYLHQMAFHDGIIDPELLRREVEKARRFVEDVASLVGESAGQL